MSERSVLAIPATIEEVTAEWLTAALSAGGSDLGVASLSSTPIGVGVGVMSVVYRLTPTYEGPKGPASLVVKFAPPFEFLRSIAAGFGMYSREVEVYRHLGAAEELHAPKCYYGDYDLEDNSFVLVIEDLVGLRSSDQIAGCAVDDARLVVRSLATMHAAWWHDERLANYSFINSPAQSPWPQFHDQSMKAAWPVILERFGDVIPERIRLLCERWSDVGPVLMEDAPKHPSTLCHGDMRLDNIFFGDDGRLTILDWQLANVAVGTNDLSYFISQSLDVEVRRTHEDALVHLYHDTLVEGGVSDYPFDELWYDYRRMLVFCLAYPITAGAGELINDRAVELGRTMLIRSIAAVIDSNADAFF